MNCDLTIQEILANSFTVGEAGAIGFTAGILFMTIVAIKLGEL